jgi:hypothetical protein
MSDLDLTQQLYATVNESPLAMKPEEDKKKTAASMAHKMMELRHRFLIMPLYGYTGNDTFIRTDPDPQWIVVDVKEGQIVDQGYRSYEEAMKAWHTVAGMELEEALAGKTPEDLAARQKELDEEAVKNREEDKEKKWYKVTKMYDETTRRDDYFYVRAKDDDEARDTVEDLWEPDDTSSGDDVNSDWVDTEVEEIDDEAAEDEVASHRYEHWKRWLSGAAKSMYEALTGKSAEDKEKTAAENARHGTLPSEVVEVDGRTYWDYWRTINGKSVEINVAQDNGELWIVDDEDGPNDGRVIREALAGKTPEDLEVRGTEIEQEREANRERNIKDAITTSKVGTKGCVYCYRRIGKGERYLAVTYRGQYGYTSRGICRECLAKAGKILGGVREMAEALAGKTPEDKEKTAQDNKADAELACLMHLYIPRWRTTLDYVKGRVPEESVHSAQDEVYRILQESLPQDWIVNIHESTSRINGEDEKLEPVREAFYNPYGTPAPGKLGGKTTQDYEDLEKFKEEERQAILKKWNEFYTTGPRATDKKKFDEVVKKFCEATGVTPKYIHYNPDQIQIPANLRQWDYAYGQEHAGIRFHAYAIKIVGQARPNWVYPTEADAQEVLNKIEEKNIQYHPHWRNYPQADIRKMLTIVTYGGMKAYLDRKKIKYQTVPTLDQKLRESIEEALAGKTPEDKAETIARLKEEDKLKKWFLVTKMYNQTEYEYFWVRAFDRVDAKRVVRYEYDQAGMDPDDTESGDNDYIDTEVEEIQKPEVHIPKWKMDRYLAQIATGKLLGEALAGKSPEDKAETERQVFVCPHCENKIPDVFLFGEQRWRAPIKNTPEGGIVDLEHIESDFFNDPHPDYWIDAECPECGENLNKSITGDIIWKHE